MKQESIDRLQAIQVAQYQALSEQDIALLEQLEVEKTQLLKELLSVKIATQQQREILEQILETQHDLERVCSEIRDELGSQITQVMQRQKAVQAYKETE